MQIRLGYELVYDCPQPTPMLLMLNIHHTRAADILAPDRLVPDPLEIGDQAERRGDEAQVVGDRLAERQDPQRERVNVHLVAVDLLVDPLDLGGEPGAKRRKSRRGRRGHTAPSQSRKADELAGKGEACLEMSLPGSKKQSTERSRSA